MLINGLDSHWVAVLLGVLGLFFGSFAGASVWRLRALQLREDKAAGIKAGKAEIKQVSKIKKSSLKNDRSVCLHCGHRLAWYDLVPLVSWLLLRGRCRYCHEKIGWFEPGIEIGLAVFFIISYLFWPVPLDTSLAIVRFVLWLVAGVGLAILLVYDAKWLLLPNRIMFPLLGIAGASSFAALAGQQFAITQLLNILTATAVLSGFYYVIYVWSNHQWVGFGDVKLGLVLALLLADWQLAILALFLANAIGTVLLLPLLIVGKVKRKAHIPFGPLLIAGWLLAGLFGQRIIDWYLLSTMGSL